MGELADMVLQQVELDEKEELSPQAPHTGRRPSPYTTTLRPTWCPTAALVRIPAAPLVPRITPRVVLEATLEEDIPVHQEEPEMYAYVVRHPHITDTVVRSMVLCAESQDLSVDQPYMPFPQTTLKEAVRHLRLNKCLGVLGGHIVIQRGKIVYRMLEMYEGKRNYTLGYAELLTVLKVNYPLRYRTPCCQVA